MNFDYSVTPFRNFYRKYIYPKETQNVSLDEKREVRHRSLSFSFLRIIICHFQLNFTESTAMLLQMKLSNDRKSRYSSFPDEFNAIEVLDSRNKGQ